jgi:antitoxin component YwqK of YwqJK toxin-antitoxin module
VVGEAARLIRATLFIAASLTAAGIAGAQSPAWTVDGNCRDGRPHGPYQLRSDNGQLRIAGAFNEGKRTGSFIFWSAQGVRAAHVPYDNDVRNGTVALWYDGPPGREPARRFESVWHRGNRDGATRSWYADGHRRAETDYADGRISRTIGWSDAGELLADDAAREMAERDEAAAGAIYAELDALIRGHLPNCE